MKSNLQFLEVEKFKEIPSRQGGGGGRSSPVLDRVRSLAVGEVLPIKITLEDNETFQDAVANVRANVYGADLEYRPRTQSDPTDSILRIYREEGSNLAYDNNNEPILSKTKDKRGNYRHLTEAEVAAEANVNADVE